MLARVQSETARAELELEEVLAAIDESFAFTPTAFSCGATRSASGENEASCRLLCWAQLRGLDRDETLACFGRHWRGLDPNGSDHANIRQLAEHGLGAVRFGEGETPGPMPLRPRAL